MPPQAPDPETREHLLDALADVLAIDGPARFLAAPVEPCPAQFPERWERTLEGVHGLVRRLAWHAGIERAIEVQDCRWGAPPTERKPATAIECVRATRTEATFAVGFIGEDDVAGTLAHEIGVLFAMLHRRDGSEPYRAAAAPEVTIDHDRDLERGSIATVALGLGVLAANAAYQQYSGNGRFNGAYVPLEYDVLRAGHIEMSELAYLVAVQAAVRGLDAPPVGLSPPQRDEVAAWLPHLDGKALRARLGIADDIAPAARQPCIPFDESRAARRARRRTTSAMDSADSGSLSQSGSRAAADSGSQPAADSGAQPVVHAPRAERPRNAFKYRSHRGGIGLVAGTVLGVGFTVACATRVPLFVVGSAGGHVLGRRIRISRCTACVSVVPDGAATCEHCGARIRGELADPAERLDAEERLGDE